MIFILYALQVSRQRFAALLSRAAARAGISPLVVAGDFNAPHQAWGYLRSSRKGEDLWQAAANLNLTLVTDPAFPTRMGNSCTRDTTPDLTFVKNVESATWHNLHVDLGSDHNVLATHISVKGKPVREFSFTDWDYFRHIRKERAQAEDSTPSLDRWAKQLKGDVSEATKRYRRIWKQIGWTAALRTS